MKNTNEFNNTKNNVSAFLAIIGANDLSDTVKKPLQDLGFVDSYGYPNVCKLNTVFSLG